MKLYLRRIGAAFCLLCVSACSSGGSDGEGADDALTNEPSWSSAFGGSRECSLTKAKCAQSYDDCMEDCWDDKANASVCGELCKDNWPCLGASGEGCGLHSYKFTGGERLSELEVACEAMWDKAVACGVNILNGCSNIARVDSPDRIPNYNCLATSECNDKGRCWPAPDSSLADEICGGVEQSCRRFSCSPAAIDSLTKISPWFRSDTVAGARKCLAEKSCREIRDCVDAWAAVAFPNVAWSFFE